MDCVQSLDKGCLFSTVSISTVVAFRGGRDSMLRDIAARCGLESHSGRTLLSYRGHP
jgi:hypothetical protein